MQELMKLLRELVAAFQQKVAEYDKKIAACDAKDKVQTETATAQADKGEKLRLLEEKHAKIENILEIEQSNKEALQKMAQEKGDLADGISAHNSQVSKDKADIEVREKGIKDDFKTLKDGQVKLAEGEKKLAEDRKEMKKKVIEEIAAKI